MMSIVKAWHRECRRQAAFTLVEVLATLALIAIVLPVAMNGISLATAAAGVAKQQMEAASLAEMYSDTGAVQAMAPQVSVLITTEEMPKPIHMVVPEYPVWAKKQGLSANVWVKAKVHPDGTIGETIILSCDNPGVGFEEAATRAATQSQFIPASANGINYAVWVIYPVRFIFRE